MKKEKEILNGIKQIRKMLEQQHKALALLINKQMYEESVENYNEVLERKARKNKKLEPHKFKSYVG